MSQKEKEDLLTYELANELFEIKEGELYWRKSGRGKSLKKPVGYIFRLPLAKTSYKKVWLRFEGKRYYFLYHRLKWLMWYGSWPSHDIDHIDGNGLHNSKENLRLSLDHENVRNRSLFKNNKSGYPGIYWNRCNKKWVVQVGIKNSKRYLGSFVELEDAIEKSKLAYIKLGFHENHGRTLCA